MSILILLLIPAIIAAVLYLLNKREITTSEFLIQLVVQSLLIFCVYGLVRNFQLSDTEVWNGRVTKKTRQQVTCRHTYDCYCVSVSCGKDCSTRVCQTCHDHSYDVDWTIFNNIGEDWDIDSPDRQGLTEPVFWSKAAPGDPTSSLHSYTNYIKNSQYSLFNKGKQTVAYPGYPTQIYAYYNLDRIISPDGVIPDLNPWKIDISSVSADLGKSKQTNLVVYVVKDKSPEYFDGLNRAWQGAKKNDVVVVINVSGSSITWVNSIAMVKDEYFRVKLRDDLMAVGKLDRAAVMSVIRTDIEKFYVRRPMSDFKYLANATKLSIGWFVLAMVLSIVISVVTSAILAGNEWRNYNESDSYSNSSRGRFDRYIPGRSRY